MSLYAVLIQPSWALNSTGPTYTGGTEAQHTPFKQLCDCPHTFCLQHSCFSVSTLYFSIRPAFMFKDPATCTSLTNKGVLWKKILFSPSHAFSFLPILPPPPLCCVAHASFPLPSCRPAADVTSLQLVSTLPPPQSLWLPSISVSHAFLLSLCLCTHSHFDLANKIWETD